MHFLTFFGQLSCFFLHFLFFTISGVLKQSGKPIHKHRLNTQKFVTFAIKTIT